MGKIGTNKKILLFNKFLIIFKFSIIDTSKVGPNALVINSGA